MKILSQCGLVVVRRQGRERLCEARLQPLQEVSYWVAQYRQFWNQKPDALETYLEQLQQKPGSKRKQSSVHHKKQSHGSKK